MDPVEYTRVELEGVDAIDKRTRTVMLFDVRINAYDFIESLTGVRYGRLGPLRPVHQAKCRNVHYRWSKNGIALAIPCRSSSSGRSLGGVRTSKSCLAAQTCYEYSEHNSAGYSVYTTRRCVKCAANWLLDRRDVEAPRCIDVSSTWEIPGALSPFPPNSTVTFPSRHSR